MRSRASGLASEGGKLDGIARSSACRPRSRDSTCWSDSESAARSSAPDMGKFSPERLLPLSASHTAPGGATPRAKWR